MILAPTLSASAGSGAAIVRPTFSRDFAGEKTLNNGTGPAITFTRASNATFFDASGVLQTASNDQPRFDHNPSTGASLGLLIEEARTNSIRNSQAGGATSSTLPTNWMSYTDVGAIAVVGTGTENGLTYVDVKFSGTNSSGAAQAGFVSGDTTAAVVASSGQTWTGSWYVKLVAGSTTGLQNVRVVIQERKSDTSLNAATATTFTPASSYQRISHSRTLTGATTARVTNEFQVGVNGGATFDLTLRIAAPQLEQGAFPTSYIPTTTAAATRSADSAVVTPISSFYNQSEGTFITDTNKSPLSGSFPTIWHLTNGTNDTGNVIGFYNPSNSTISYDASPAFSYARAVSAGPASSGFAFSAASSRIAVNGALTPSTDQPSTITTDKASLRLGAKRNGSEPLNGHIRKIAYYPRRLSNTLLQQLTT